MRSCAESEARGFGDNELRKYGYAGRWRHALTMNNIAVYTRLRAPVAPSALTVDLP